MYETALSAAPRPSDRSSVRASDFLEIAKP